ncbi:MAG TPA: YggT family protein [Roseiflexaceae bacterium]|nr:YggT family protein [Roseiflexaceae bacterium]
MTEREYIREPSPERRDVYQETVVERPGAPADGSHEVYEQRAYGPGGEQVVRSEHVSVPSDAAQRSAGVERAKQVIYYVFGVVEALLAIRFVLLLLGANEASGFVRLIYGLSQPFVLPFQGIFGVPSFEGSAIEWSSLVAIVVYLLVAYGLARLIELVYAPARPPSTRGR